MALSVNRRGSGKAKGEAVTNLTTAVYDWSTEGRENEEAKAEAVKHFAARHGLSVSEAIQNLVDRGMGISVLTDDLSEAEAGEEISELAEAILGEVTETEAEPQGG